MTDQIRKNFIEKYYNGDADAYDKNMTSDDPERDAAYFAFGDRPTTHWQDIERHVKCHPEYEELALAWINFILGYVPQQHAYMPYLSFLQTLFETSETGKISDENFSKELIFYVKKVRNEDMKRGGWVLKKTFSKTDLDFYNSHLALYKQGARNRLSKLLGYDPLLEHSLEAEIFLRQIFQEEFFHADMAYCNADYIAATIVKYREIFLRDGEAAADASEMTLWHKDLDMFLKQ